MAFFLPVLLFVFLKKMLKLTPNSCEISQENILLIIRLRIDKWFENDLGEVENIVRVRFLIYRFLKIITGHSH